MASDIDTRILPTWIQTPQKGSATLTSLERRDDSKGSAGEDSEQTNDALRDKIELSSMSLSSGINNVGDGYADLPKDIKAIEKAIGGMAGELMVKYLRKVLYVNHLIEDWIRTLTNPTLEFIKSGLGDAEYSKVEPALKDTIDKVLLEIKTHLNPALKAILSIIANSGSVIQNVDAVKSFGSVFDAYKAFFETLKPQLEKFGAGKNTYGYFTDINVSISKFSAEQQKLHDEMMQALKAAPSQ
ncbi:hypothetical protein BASA60_010713 [Batrachochytrium salamandrivorans]|nr:hypothetical protein BASA60_010713 [Batrachochytrium salamandrivorans]